MIKRENKFKVDYGYNEIYNHYNEFTTKPLTKEKYNSVFKNIFENMMLDIIKKGKSIEFPYKFGNLEIQKRKQKIIYNTDGSVNRIHYKVDWKATKDHWACIYKNLNSDEIKTIKGKPKIYCKNKYRMSFKYIKNNAHYKAKSVIMFIPNRKWCRELANHLKNNPYATDYKEQ
jgi:nucleoid DNA-binding protein